MSDYIRGGDITQLRPKNRLTKARRRLFAYYRRTQELSEFVLNRSFWGSLGWLGDADGPALRGLRVPCGFQRG